MMRLIQKCIRQTYIIEEIERFKQAATNAIVGEDNDEMTPYLELAGFLEKEQELSISVKAKIQTENIKIRLLNEMQNLMVKKIEDEIIFVSGFAGRNEEVLYLKALNKRKEILAFNSKKIAYLKKQIGKHKNRLIELKRIEDNRETEGEIDKRFSMIKKKLMQLQLLFVLSEMEKDFEEDGELASVREAVKELKKMNSLGTIEYANYREGLLKQGLYLLDIVDKFYENEFHTM